MPLEGLQPLMTQSRVSVARGTYDPRSIYRVRFYNFKVLVSFMVSSPSTKDSLVSL